MLNRRSYSVFYRTIAALLAIILILSDVPLSVYANEGEASADVTYCGLEEHVHTEECYESQQVLVCGETSEEGPVLQCGLEESEEHTHDASCYADGGHEHTEDCYQTVRTLICGKEEHQHSAECYIDPDAENQDAENPDTESQDAESADDSAAPVAEDGQSDGSIVITDYNQDFIAYNYYCYLNSTGDAVIGGTGYSISGSSGTNSIIIGDQTGDGLTEDQQPKTKDIDVKLNGLTLTDQAVFEVRPVYAGANKVAAEVVNASALKQLNLKKKASMTLAVKADTMITNLTLEEDTDLSVTVADGVTLTLGTVTGSGKLSIAGTGTVIVSDQIEVGELEITGATVTGSSQAATVTAINSLTLHSGTVKQLSLFGYADSVSGSRTLTLEGGNFYDVVAVGVSESNTAATLNISGLNLVGLTNTNVYQDYSITYQYNGTAINGEGWPQTYRVKCASVYDAAHASTVGGRTLPAYALSGYVFTGWQMQEEESQVVELPESGVIGDLVLSAQMQAGAVGVTFDLGFEPTELTNDKDAEGNLPSGTWTQAAAVGEELSLTEPSRFGYVFTGWKITTGETRQISAGETSTSIAYSDLTDNEGTYVLNLEAQWELDTFPIRLQPKIGFDSSISDMEISVDGGTSWLTLEQLAAQYPNMSWDAKSETCSFSIEIQYQESLGDFFKRVFGADSAYPILRDTRAVASGKLRFVCWKTADGTTLQSYSLYDLGNDGFLTKSDGQTLNAFQADLKTSPVVLGTAWSSTLKYTLTTDLPEGWSVLVGGKTDAFAATPDEDGSISVDAAQAVYYRVSRSSDERISAWMFTANQGTSMLYPALETVASSDQYLYYKLTMPNSDVVASYSGGGDAVYVDLLLSPITLAENVSYAGLTDISGFWYSSQMEKKNYDGMTVNAMTPLFFTTDKENASAYTAVTGDEAGNSGWYFYEYGWNNNPFYVTSRNEATTNQLTLVNKTSIYLKDCNLTATDSFRDKATGRNLAGTKYNAANADLREYGNIVADFSAISYDVSVYVDGSSTVASICTDKFYTDRQHYNTINLYGKNSTRTKDVLTLGTILGSFAVNFNSLTVQQYEKGAGYTDFEPIVAARTNGDGSPQSYMTDCVLNAPDRVWCGTYRTRFASSRIEIQSFPSGETTLYVAQPSFIDCDVHVYGDLYFNHYFTATGKTSIVVDGNLLQTSNSILHRAIINIDGSIIVKGNRCTFSELEMDKGTLICNALMISPNSVFKGGTVITNVLSERTTTGNSSETNADGYPFGRVPNSQSGTYNFDFSGSNVYLFGHYSTTPNGSYDPILDQSAKAVDKDNPLNPIAERYLEGGEYTADELSSAVAAAVCTNECVALGKTDYIVGNAAVRNVRITGGSIYAAGNITFYNDTTVSGGTVVSWGSFASKRDLFITGGAVYAAAVGNAYNTPRSENGIVRWAQTAITGGSVKTDRIGALTSSIRGAEARSYVSIFKAASIASFSDSVAACSDLKVNCHLSDGLTQPSAEEFPENVRYLTSNYQSGKEFEGQLCLSETETSTKVSFEPPQAEAGGNAEWALNSLNGAIVQHVDNSGYLNGDTDSNVVYSTAKSIELYAVKNDNTLIIREGENYLSQALVTDSDDKTTDLIFTDGTANVKSGSTVSFKVPAAMKDKVIVCYYDDSQVLYNACTSDPQANTDGTYTFRFEMPRSATEIWISDYFDLYLNDYAVTFTADGFATEYGTPSADKSGYTFDTARSFSYQGGIRLSENGAVTVRNTSRLTPGGSNSGNPVTFSSGAATSNLIHFTGDFDNLSAGAQQREIILSNLIQTYTEQGSKQTVLEEGSQVRIGINGHVGLYTVHVPKTANIEIYGVNEGANTGLELQDTLWIHGYKNYSLGNNNGACGNITLKGLFIGQLSSAAGGIGCGYQYKSAAALTMHNCTLVNNNCYEATWIAEGLQSVVLDQCYFDVILSPDWTGKLIQNCHSVSLTGGTVYNLKYGAKYASTAPFTVTQNAKAWYQDAVFTIEDSQMNILTNYATDRGICLSFDWMYDVVLKGNSSLTADRYLALDKLTMQGSSVVTVGDDNHNGYLFCSDITVEDSACLNADYIAISGFYTATDPSANPHYGQGAATEDAWRKEVADGTYIRSGGTLTMNGGTVNAAQFVGGDVNGVITVKGGTLNAPRIGNLGAYLGILTTMPQTDTEWCLFYEKVPTAGEAASVAISGGTVNVGENGYLGGMNADVSISGGTVNLADGAVLGMTETQKNTLSDFYSVAGDSIGNHNATNCKLVVSGGTVSGSNGSISAPYGSVEIYEAEGNDTQVSVQNCTAESGTITIKNACDGIDNPYPEGEPGVSPNVGVLVSGTLSAMNLAILDGAAVYAEQAYSAVKAGENGVLEISEDKAGSSVHTALYPGSYFGMMGSGEVEYRTVHSFPSGGYQQNVYGTKRVRIRYELCDDTTDPAANAAENPDGFLVGSNEESEYRITLSAPTRFGYDFAGWYEQEDYSGDPVTQILTTNSKDIVLYAKWTPRMIPFTVSVATDSVADLVTANETEGLSGSFNGEKNIFTFESVITVPYRSVIIGSANTENQIHLVDYQLTTYSITEMVWKNGDTKTVLSSGSTTVDHSMVNAYDISGESLTLFVNAVAKRRFLLTMDLNLEGGLPKDAVFNNTTDPDRSTSTTISSYTDFGRTFGDAAGFALEGKLIVPTAPGYSFMGWNTKADGTGETITENEIVSSSSPHNVYAIWKANAYSLVFDAGSGNLVTEGSDVPTGADAQQTITGTVIYDQKIRGNINYGEENTSAGFPYAWKKGYVFLGWCFGDEKDSVNLTPRIKLNLEDIPCLKLGEGNALTLHAVYRKIKVTYNTNGGTWQDATLGSGKSSVTVDAPDYGEALAGYVKDAVADTAGNYVLTGTVSGDITYAAYSTTIKAYSSGEAHQYVTGDYRNTILRKGYTFFGWYTTEEAAQAAADQDTAENAFFPDSYTGAVGTVPEYQDITLYASWKPNEYSLTLHAGTSRYSEMKQDNVASGQTIPLRISDEVNGTYIADTEKDLRWPKHSDWYAYSKGSSDENAKRYLLGFTFDELDPGDSQEDSEGYDAYISYASKVTQLIQQDDIFYKAEGDTSGTIFHLPEDENYGDTVITGTTVVPDYPTGYTIPLYAVYRERSLVFIEYVVDANGTPSRTVLGSYPYNQYVDFPAQYLSSQSYQNLTAAGYKLLKWGVNGYGIDAVPYEETTYDQNKESYKATASSMGTFDINVYTVYAAQVTDTAPKLLAASGDPTASNVSSYTYKLPMSMQNGVIQYQLLANDGSTYNGFELVTKDAMDANRYSPAYGQKIALTMQILGSDGNAVGEEVDLTSSNKSVLFSTASIGAGYSVRLRMYHSSVMTAEESKTISLKCSFYRNSTGSEDMQQFFWLKNIQTKLTPSVYTVVYDADLPTAADLTVKNWNGFASQGDNYGKRTVATAYGSGLLNAVPVLEGYTANETWTRTKADGTAYSGTGSSVAYGAALTLPVDASDHGMIYLKSSYQINTYKLTLTKDVLDKWNVLIDGQAVTEGTVNVQYHQTISFTGKTKDEPAEFIRLEHDGSGLGELDLYADSGEGNTYTFKMPSHDMDAAYMDVKTLYLEDGSIELVNSGSENGYRQGEQTLRTWRGKYQILMDANNNEDGSSTENRLVIDGDFANREVKLGKLNIAADDAIELKANTTAALQASAIQARNIAVPAKANLSLSSESETMAELTLTPAVGYAAIGGHDAASGEITLDHLKLSMTLPAGSAASGIGAGNQTTLDGCGKITLASCEVIAEEKTTASSAFTGNWIGGNEVDIQSSVLSKLPDSDSMYGPYVLKCTSASISKSQIGSSENPVNDPIYALDRLTITESEIYQRIEAPLGNVAALGTGDDGTIHVTKGTIAASFSGNGSSNRLYTGKLMIGDADSSVNIKDIQLLDVNNGSITIGQKQVIQNNKTHAHTGSYLLLSEFDSYDEKSSLTVDGLTGNARVQVSDMKLQKLTANCDTPLYLNGDLEVSGTTEIAADQTLSVVSETNCFTAAGFSGKGNYKQSGGELKGTNDLIVGGSMTLDNVNAALSGYKLGSNGAAGVTTVAIRDSEVTAAEVGALGEQSQTFTFVVDDNSTIGGNLIQDHYRIRYDLTDKKYDVSELPSVLRSTTTTDGTAAFVPDIPEAPQCSGTSSFQKWYITRADGTNVVLSEEAVSGFTVNGTLDASYLSDAEDTGDGTKTLTLHAWMGLEGKAMILSGSIFKDMGTITDTSPSSASVISNGQWTARFETQGTVISGSKYQFAFEKSIPKGTKLTLCDRSGESLKWYYYSAETDVSTVNSDQFTAMGDTSPANLIDGNEGDALEHVLQLTADFSDTEAGAGSNKVTMNLLVNDVELEIPGISLPYTANPAASAAITANESTISVAVTPDADSRLDGEKLYAVAVIEAAANQSVSVPYGASAKCGESTGTWLGGNTIAFELSNYKAVKEAYAWSISGLSAGNYSVTWYLTAASDLKNPFDSILAEAAPVLIQPEVITMPSMTATLTEVDGAAPTGQVLAAGSVHEVSFTVETNQQAVDYCVEKQTELKSFENVQDEKGTVSGKTVTITIPGDAGTYRVRFSIKENSDCDDVYCSFIVK